MVVVVIAGVVVMVAVIITVRVVMIVVVTIVVMLMTVIVAMRVMMMIVMMMLADGRVSATFRLERRLDRHDLGPKVLQQLFNRGVGPQPQPPFQDLHWHVPVAEMPGKPRQGREIAGARLDQRLSLGHHLDQATVLEHERIVGAQPQRFGEVKLDAGAFDAEQKALLDLPLRERQDQRIDGRVIAAIVGRKDAGGARHVRFRANGAGSVEPGRPLGLLRRVRGRR
jgi:hypothetical protein